MTDSTYTFAPYDVLQVERGGQWLDFTTLRTEAEARTARLMVERGFWDGDNLTANFRIVRNSPRMGIVVYTRAEELSEAAKREAQQARINWEFER